MNYREWDKDQIIRALLSCQQRVTEIEGLQEAGKGTLTGAGSLFEELFELCPDALVVIDPEARIKRVNTAAERLFGYTREELIGQDHDMLVPDRFKARHGSELKAYMMQPRVRVMGIGLELWARHKNGTEFPADIDLGPMEIGGELRVIAVVRDVTPRKELEQDLVRSEKRYRELVELSPDAVMVNVEGTVQFLNAAGARLFGLESPKQLVGKPVMDIIHPDNREMARERARQIREEGKVVPLVEEKFLRADGSVIYVDAISMPYTFEGIPAILSIIRDITARKLAEAAKKEAEERFRRTLDNMLEGCQIIGFDWRYLYINDVAAVHARRRKEKLLGHTVTEMFPGIEESEAYRHLREAMEKRVVVRVDLEFTFPDGVKRWFDLRIQPVPEGIFVLSIDISERKKLEQELATYRQRLEETVVERTAELARANKKLTEEVDERRKASEGLQLRATILDNAAEAIFLINPSGDVVYANEAASKSYGFNHEEFLAMNVRKLLPPKDLHLVEERLRKAMETGRLDTEGLHLRKDGSYMPVRIRHTLVRTLHGQFIVSVSREIEAECKMRLILEQIPCFFWTTDKELKLTSLMGAALAALGLEPGQGTGMALADYLEGQGFEKSVAAAHLRALAGASVGYRFKNTRTGKTYQGWAAPYRNVAGEPAGTIGVALEVTPVRAKKAS